MVGLVAAVLVAVVGFAAWAVVFPGPVDDYSSYQPETKCREKPRPGTVKLARWINKRFEGGTAVASMRACSSSSSEHQDGRAIDWTMDATDDAERAEVERFLAKLFAADADGNEHALARRMGIMYLIWDDHIYSSYGTPHFAARDYLSSSCSSVEKCSATLRHRDHVHLSLSKPGGRAETTWYLRTPS